MFDLESSGVVWGYGLMGKGKVKKKNNKNRSPEVRSHKTYTH